MKIKKLAVKRIDSPLISPVEEKNKYVLINDTQFWLEWNGGCHHVKVDSGFVFDGASIPRVFWTAVGNPYTPDFLDAALLHDWLYNNKTGYNRREADDMFYHVLRYNGVNVVVARTMHRAVRTFGRWCYKGSK